MRTNEERIAAMHARAAELKREKRAARTRRLQAAAGLVCLAAVLALAAAMPGLMASIPPEVAADNMRGSIFGEGGALGYVVVGVVAFLLGIALTVFCVRLKKWRDGDGGEDRK